MPSTTRIDWTTTPIQFIPLATCDGCGSPRYDCQRSVGNGDGSRTKFVICRDCGLAYRIASEIPEFGNSEIAFVRIEP